MLKVYYGDDRVRAQSAIKKELGSNYEVFEAENLQVADLDSVFWGLSLFGEERKILIKDLSKNSECFEKLSDYAGTSHRVIVWEESLDKRKVAYKNLTKKKVEIKEFKVPEAVDPKAVFNVFDLAWSGQGKKAVELSREIEAENDPYMFFGLLVSQVTKKLELGMHSSAGARAAMILKKMAEIDLAMKTASMEAWLLIRTLLLEIAASK